MERYEKTIIDLSAIFPFGADKIRVSQSNTKIHRAGFPLPYLRVTKWKMPLTWSDIFKIILAIILPPIGVLLERGLSIDLLINILLTILGYIPGTSIE